MQLPRVRFTVRTALVLIAALTPFLAGLAFLNDLTRQFDTAYGQGARDAQQAAADLYHAAGARGGGRIGEAEALYRSALAAAESSERLDSPVGSATAGLADVLHVQGKDGEALEVFRHGLAVLEGRVGRRDPSTVEILVPYAAFLRSCGDTVEAAKFESRARRSGDPASIPLAVKP